MFFGFRLLVVTVTSRQEIQIAQNNYSATHVDKRPGQRGDKRKSQRDDKAMVFLFIISLTFKQAVRACNGVCLVETHVALTMLNAASDFLT